MSKQIVWLVCFAIWATTAFAADTSSTADKTASSSQADLSRYDTFNISDCLAIYPFSDEKDPTIMVGYEVAGISSCLSDAASKVLRAKQTTASKDDMGSAASTAENTGSNLQADSPQYDTFNISNCIAISPIVDDKDSSLVTGYEVIGISICLSDAATKVLKAKETSASKKDDMDTASNVWPIYGPGYGFPGHHGGWYPRAWTDPQFNYGADYDHAPRDPTLHPYRIDNPGFPNVARALRLQRPAQ